jgi:hypothetical protein
MWQKRPVLEVISRLSLVTMPGFLDDFARFCVDCDWGNSKLTIREIIAEQRRRLSSANPAERLERC